MNRPSRSETLRHRSFQSLNDGYTSPAVGRYVEEGKQLERKIKYPLAAPYLLFVLILIVTTFVAVIVIEKKLPHGIKVSEEWKYPNRFIAERAKRFLYNLTEIGPRIAGSAENEVKAVQLLVREINAVISEANDAHRIELDVQKASGAYSLRFLDGLTIVYNNMQNVVVKVNSRDNSPFSLLINCHFDSVTDSPGASDDGAGCAVMIEMLRIIVKYNTPFRHNIIFLFNGAEENFMPASHGFITQHPWAKEVQVFINLEACGAGGRELLFQAGPNHPWILEIYSKVVPYPYASSLAQEIFQSGLIPGDTDYRIFRDYGHVSGLDFAWSTNGYVYHTKFDAIDYVPLGSLQRTGDNILALVRGIANAHQLSNVKKYRSGNLVFFDFLGAFVIRWSEFLSNFINTTAIMLSIYVIRKNKEESLDKSNHYRKLLRCLIGVVLSWFVVVVVVVSIAVALNVLGRTMAWFARPLWIFFLYICPTLLVSFVFIRNYSRGLSQEYKDPWRVFELYYDAVQLIWSVILLVCVILRIRSGFIPLTWVVFSTIANFVQRNYFRRWRDWRWLTFHVLIIGLPFVQSFYLILGALNLFIPIMGRSGAGNNSEIIIAVMVGLLFALLNSFTTPLVLLTKDPEKVITVLLGVFLMSIGILLLTPFGFPYSGDPKAPAPQRFMIAHTKRTFHDVNNNSRTSNGYWIADLDINSPFTVSHLVPEMRAAEAVQEDCHLYLYCGQPYLVPVQSFIWKTHWLPGPQPQIHTPTNMRIMKRIRTDYGEKFVFNITGPDHIGMMLSPFPGVKLLNWSVSEDPPLHALDWKDKRRTYFIYYAYGGTPVPLNVTIELMYPRSHVGPVVDLAVTSHIMHGPEKTSDQFRRLIDKFPVWTAVTSWTATYESWVL